MGVLSNRNEKGFSTAWILVFCVLLLMVGGFFYSVSMSLVYRQQYVAIADSAARAGATAIDEQKMIDSNTVELDPAEAPARCMDVIANSKRSTDITGRSCVVSGAVITVTLEGKKHYSALIESLVPSASSQNYTITAYARPTCSDSTTLTGSC